MFTAAEIANLSGFDFESACRENTTFDQVGENKATCTILGKHKIYIDTRDEAVVPHLINDGFWETWVTQQLSSIIKPGDICVDVGANYGYFTLLMSELAGEQGETIAVEPNPHICELLRETQKIHPYSFLIAETAVANTVGTIDLNIPRNLGGDGSIIKRSDRVDVQSSKIKVALTTLDLLVKKLELKKVDVIKIDVEGVEPLVLAGMKDTIKRNPELKVIIEYSPFLYEDPSAFTEYLFQNFQVERIKDVEFPTILAVKDINHLVNLQDHTDLYLVSRSM